MNKKIEIEHSLKKLAQTHPEIVALYVFGSQATGQVGPLSDLDVAVLLEDRVPTSKYFRTRLDLLGEAMGSSHRSDVDLVLLNEASPLLAYEVVRSGRLLFERDHSKRVAYEARAVGQYLDLKSFYEISNSYIK